MLVEVSLERILHNYRVVSSLGAPEVAAVLKGNAYGHGIVSVATSLMNAGVEKFVVGSLYEAQILMDLGARWVLWLYPTPMELSQVNDEGFWDVVRVAVPDVAVLGYLPSRARFHMYVDVGFGVYGVDNLSEQLLMDERLEGIWSHIGWLEDVPDEARLRTLAYEKFMKICRLAQDRHPGLMCHICGTSMTVYTGGCSGTSFVRVGVGLYGYAEASLLDQRLKPAMRWLGEVVSIYKTDTRHSLFYSSIDVKPGWIVVVRAGYSDGYIPSDWAYSPSGMPLRRLSHVTMNLTAFWSEDHPGVGVGDTLLLMNNAREIANAAGIPLEQVLCSGGRGKIRYVDF